MATTKEVQSWWEENPFTLGLAKNKDLVGRIDPEQMDLHYFKEVERKFRKHARGGGQEDGQPLLSKLVDYSWLKGKKTLDIAVGTGFSTVAFAQGGADVTGIDLTNFAVEQTKKNLQCRGLVGQVMQMDAQNMTFADETFEFVNAWGCLMHMPDTQKAINETCRVLKPNGRFLAYMYNRNSWTFWFNFIFLRGILLLGLIRCGFSITKLTSRYTDGSIKGKGNMLTKLYTKKQVADMFKKAGYTKVKTFAWYLPDEPNHWPLRKMPLFKYLPAKIREFLGRKFGFGLIVQCEK